MIHEGMALGLALQSPDLCAEVLSRLETKDFTTVNHQAAYQAIQKLARDGEPVDVLTVSQTSVGHTETLPLELSYYQTEATGRASFLGFSVSEVRRLSMGRQMSRALEQAASDLKSGEDAVEVRSRLYETLFGLGDHDQIRTWAPDLLPETEQRARDQIAGLRTPHLKTGWKNFDRQFGGLPRGVITLGAQSGSGKTSAAISLASRVVARGETVLFVSLEMAAEDIIDRFVSHESGIETGRIGQPGWKEHDTSQWMSAVSDVMARPLHIWAPGSATPNDIYDKARAVKAMHGLSLIVVDYDELVTEKGSNEVDRMTTVVRGLKRSAQELSAPLLLLSQYPKEGSQPGGTPQNRWLKGSKAKEDVSSMIIHWYWPEHWIRTNQVVSFDITKPKNWGRFYVTKNRGGVPGNSEILFFPGTSVFREPEMVR